MESFDTVILGAGPAGLTAGIYLARAKQSVLILDKGMTGGQVNLTHAVANYPGLGEVPGYQLASNMKKQATEFGCQIKNNVRNLELDLNGEVKKIQCSAGSFEARTVILAMGGEPRKLGISSELDFQGKGVSYCATCDGDFFTGHDIMVVGGGNSALEEAVSLTKYANSVTIVHQFDHFQAYPIAIAEAEKNSKIKFIMESEVLNFYGEPTLKGVKIRNKKTKSETDLNVTGAFIFIGYVPSSQLISNQVKCSDRGEIIVSDGMKTNVPGVFAAGDIIQKKWRQITTAVSDGTIAALDALDYLNGVDPDK